MALTFCLCLCIILFSGCKPSGSGSPEPESNVIALPRPLVVVGSPTQIQLGSLAALYDYGALPQPSYPTDVHGLNTDVLVIGQGIHTATGEKGGLAVVYNHQPDEELTTVIENSGIRTRFDFHQIKSVEELKKSLRVDAAASLGWGIYKGDAAAEFFQSGSFTKYNNFLFIDIEVKNASKILKK